MAKAQPQEAHSGMTTFTDHKFVMHSGERWYLFAADYQHDGRTFSFEFYARSADEATDRLRSIRTTCVEFHQIYAQIPAGIPLAKWYARAFCWIRNLFS